MAAGNGRGQMRGRVGAPVDRDGYAGRKERCCLGGDFRGRDGRGRERGPQPQIGSSARSTGPAPPSRGKRPCRRRSTHTPSALEHEADREPRPAPGSRAARSCVGRPHRDRAGGDLDRRAAPPSRSRNPRRSQVLRCAGRRNQPDVLAEAQERARVEVVAVLVWRRGSRRAVGRYGQWRGAAEVHDPSAKQRVGHERRTTAAIERRERMHSRQDCAAAERDRAR